MVVDYQLGPDKADNDCRTLEVCYIQSQHCPMHGGAGDVVYPGGVHSNHENSLCDTKTCSILGLST
jgi:hypothetical protein